ncbi:hypothetical protein LSH36_303g00003 [Paralvinella palmiformis]|uniref:Uncharacterized protein n=1 Tax=Paralvinella palmiformis TaxID=53620 RepID=A0AAD9JHS6_9ANNE|nr:hypothetical protein LSH36_303g00003 [Paralvinella palmiformis]
MNFLKAGNGSGIFVSPSGLALRSGSVAMSVVYWTICGIISTMGALCLAELGTLIPQSGGEYVYLNAAFGTVPAYMCSWLSVLLLKPASCAIMSLTCAEYIMIPLLQMSCTQPPTAIIQILAVAIVLFLTTVNCYSVKLANKIQIVFTVTKVGSMIVIIIGGIMNITKGETRYLENGFHGTETYIGNIALSLYSGMWAYDGWNNLNYVTEELINPYVLTFVAARQGHMPKVFSYLHIHRYTPVPSLILTVPLFVPYLVLLISIFLVLVPIIAQPQAEFLYAILFIVSGLVSYLTFVYYKKQFPVIDIGVYITNVSQSDAGIYRFEYTFPDQLRRSELLLYLFQAPTKPVISQRISTNDVILTCNSMSQSLPEQYRTNSWMGYNWKVTSSLEVYVTEGNQVRIKRPWKSCHLFECWSREENSTLTSPTTRYLVNDVRFYDESVVILLGVFLLLAIGVAVVVGVVAFLRRRRLKREMAKFQQNNRNLVDFSRERRQPFYHKDVALTVSPTTSELCYEEPGSSLDLPN